jgi:hypothetical protein
VAEAARWRAVTIRQDQHQQCCDVLVRQLNSGWRRSRNLVSAYAGACVTLVAGLTVVKSHLVV